MSTDCERTKRPSYGELQRTSGHEDIEKGGHPYQNLSPYGNSAYDIAEGGYVLCVGYLFEERLFGCTCVDEPWKTTIRSEGEGARGGTTWQRPGSG